MFVYFDRNRRYFFRSSVESLPFINIPMRCYSYIRIVMLIILFFFFSWNSTPRPMFRTRHNAIAETWTRCLFAKWLLEIDMSSRFPLRWHWVSINFLFIFLLINKWLVKLLRSQVTQTNEKNDLLILFYFFQQMRIWRSHWQKLSRSFWWSYTNVSKLLSTHWMWWWSRQRAVRIWIQLTVKLINMTKTNSCIVINFWCECLWLVSSNVLLLEILSF